MGAAVGTAAAGLFYLLRPKRDVVYPYEPAKQEAINRAKDYEENPMLLDDLMLGKRTPPTQKDIDTVKKFDPRTADILEISKDLKAAENDPAKQEEILGSWKKRLDERAAQTAAQSAETVRQ